eukprot:2987785-Pyramimonas_sp.AAC.2
MEEGSREEAGGRKDREEPGGVKNRLRWGEAGRHSPGGPPPPPSRPPPPPRASILPERVRRDITCGCRHGATYGYNGAT